ncbi:MAG TPA: hypothetical protein VEQ15_00375 [Myxococcales bacterium]|nr:hypothetical protein [Myxococcales bacterium]
MTSSYFPGGPDRPADPFPLTDAAEVAAARRWLRSAYGRAPELGARVPFATVTGADRDWLSEVELFGSAEELGAARDRELWGDDPFGED